MDDFEDFEVVFSSNLNVAYDQQTLKQIRHNRQLMENELFVDRLLRALGVKQASELYPPESNESLRALHERIIASSSPDHHKHSVLYYLLKDVPQPGREAAEEFAKASYLPDKYKTFVDGIWYMDRLKFERALDYLTEPALIPTFPEEILYTLCRHAPDNDVTLPVAYYHTVSPSITSNKVLETYFLTLCRASITEAFYFSRTQGDLNHRVLFEKLIIFVHANSSGAIKATRAVELISLPLNDDEESWFNEFLEEGEGRTLPGASDTVIMKKIATGRPVPELDNGAIRSGRKIDGVNWATLTGSMRMAQQ